MKIYDKQFTYFKTINVNLNYVQLTINNINKYKKFINIQMQYAMYQGSEIESFKKGNNYKNENTQSDLIKLA